MESFLNAEVSAVRRVWKRECTLSGREIARTLGCSATWTSVGVLSLVVGTSRVGSESVFDSTRTAPAAPVAARYAVRDARSWHIGQVSSIPSKGRIHLQLAFGASWSWGESVCLCHLPFKFLVCFSFSSLFPPLPTSQANCLRTQQTRRFSIVLCQRDQHITLGKKLGTVKHPIQTQT